MVILITVLLAAVVVVIVKVPPVPRETSDIQVKLHLAFIDTVILIVILRIGCSGRYLGLTGMK